MQIDTWKLTRSNEDNFYCELFGDEKEAEKAYIEAVNALQDEADEDFPKNMTYDEAKKLYSCLLSEGITIGSMFIEIDTVNISEEVLIAGLNKRGFKVVDDNKTSSGETYLVIIDHVDGPCTQLCDTEANAKAFVFGHILSYETFEEFDVALKGSIDAVDGIVDYSIVKQKAKDYVEVDNGVTLTLSDGDKKLPVRVAYNDAVASGEMLIYSETNFGGAPNAPIAILLTDGKLDVRVWQPKDMGTDPTSVTVVEHYGVYEVETLACGLKEIGSEKDYDQLFRQKGFDNGEVAATAKIDVDGETYDIVIGVVGDQEVYANYAENEEGDDVLVSLDEDGTQKRLRREPNEFMRAKMLESESNQAYLAWSANCWLNIEILKNGESVGNYGDQFGSSFGSIQDCFEAVCENDIRQMLGEAIAAV